MRENAALLAALMIAGCAPSPFDATSPVGPTTTGADRSFAEGFRAQPPAAGFEAYESGATPAEDVTVPGQGGGNPWAERPENVIVQVCYGRLLNSRADVNAAARDLCPRNARLRYLGSDTVFNRCPLIQPSRAVYRCVAPEGTASPGSDSG